MDGRRALIAFSWGALPAAVLAFLVLTLSAPLMPLWALLVLAAPLVEEPLKAVAAFVAPAGRRAGALAGAAAGLGFGLAEMAFRSLLAPPAGLTLLAPALHVAASALAGAGVADARVGQRATAGALLAAAIGMHAAFNAAALAQG